MLEEEEDGGGELAEKGKLERIKERYWKSHEDAREGETRGRGTSLIRV